MLALTGYGTASGLKLWSVIPLIRELPERDAGNLVTRAQSLLSVYHLDASKNGFSQLITEAIYLVAEGLYFYGINARAIFTPYTEERMGGYQYRKMSPVGSALGIIEGNPTIQAILTHLADSRDMVLKKPGQPGSDYTLEHLWRDYRDWFVNHSNEAAMMSVFGYEGWRSSVYGEGSPLW